MLQLLIMNQTEPLLMATLAPHPTIKTNKGHTTIK
jgi:hypothetical protein